MRTDDLIQALAEDRHAVTSPRRALLVALVVSVPIVALLFALTLGPRPHLLSLFTGSWRFAFKVAAMLAIAVLAGHGVWKLTNPVERPERAARHLLPALLLLAGGIAVELMSVPADQLMPRIIGHNATACMVFVPFFSLTPLAAFLYAMRNGAPASATATGALIGVLSAALGAAFYALHCPDDSPLFVVTWYSVGFAVVTAAGALIGRRALRW